MTPADTETTRTPPYSGQPGAAEHGRAADLRQDLQVLYSAPPLVMDTEVSRLRRRLGEAAARKAFVFAAANGLPAGNPMSAQSVQSHLEIILAFSAIVMYETGLRVVRVASTDGEGGAVQERTLSDRYRSEVGVLNFVRGCSSGGQADLRNVRHWSPEFIRESPSGLRYDLTVDAIERALSFFDACRMGADEGSLFSSEFYVSHQATDPDYEQGMTRRSRSDADWFDTSTHMLWVDAGELAEHRFPEHLITGINNPVGTVFDSRSDPEILIRFVEAVSAGDPHGRLAIAVAAEDDAEGEKIAALARRISDLGCTPVWMCDAVPQVSGIAAPVAFGRVHQRFLATEAALESAGIALSGIRMPLTHEDVDECIGGTWLSGSGRSPAILPKAPRLNARQVIDLAYLIADHLKTR
ncbi:3-deoxy-7-phosphoheptulonate synthase [Glycomyces luteolus]|uniref:Phospho-2-dehydro-3-deoxyheptonate aldolase n=1 Tax=Glycomyces luteolus TaxID=2670330 RepID=A0A9X3SSB2_9ACTN|nr:3-deoxy-7-phosphoheptulonate synthase [Glycomyces luteolus]MDA1362712.1 3-deoxy-7-phosphoheptulonate synthase [Glycomyces luteolus]